MGWLAVVVALCGIAYAAATVWAIGRFGPAARGASAFPAVTVLKPLHGTEPDLRANLESFCSQDYPGRVQFVFGVQASNDAAIPVVEALKAEYPDLDIALVCSGARAANPKIANLIGMLPHARHEILVLSDSDIGVAPDYLRAVVGSLEQPGVGAVTCCYVGRARDNVWSRMAAMGIDYQFLPGVILGLALGLARPCFGSTIALSKRILREIGGFEAFAEELADDYEIGRAVRSYGYDVAISSTVVTHSCPEASAGAFFHHELRWARTIRAVEPFGYAGGVVTHMVPISVIGALFLGFAHASVMVVLAAFVARVAMKGQIDRRFGSGLPVWLLPFWDVLSFAIFANAFFARRIDWRGQQFQLDRTGILIRE
jgi:ceramide glucosyltransferase